MLALTVLVLCVLAARLYDRAWVNAPVILLVSLLAPLLVFDFRLSGLTLVVLYTAALSFVAGYYAVVIQGRLNDACRATQRPAPACEYRGLQGVLVLLFILGQAAFAVNLLRVVSTLGISAYVGTSAKDIEVVFGASTVINYIFFLNMLAACIAAYLKGSGRGRWWITVIMLWAVLSLGFTGIKSTLMFGACMVLFVYILVKQVTIARLALSGAALMAAALLLFAVVNLGPGSLVEDTPANALVERVLDVAKGYVYNNYINLDMELTTRTTFTHGKFTFFFVSKLLNPQISGYFDTDDFIVLNKDYNMGTFVREYFVDFGVPGALIIPLFLGLITGLIANQWRRRRQLRHAIALGVLWTACAFAFFGNQFVRLQFIYVVFVAYVLDFWLNARRTAPGPASACNAVQ
jgi:oligosaccharide repeat unit polymerase